jgi:transmembrane protein TMEM260 (protein O-mannosyltransferase)
LLAVYVRTAAPSVLSGDSAEFQLAAPLLGVPHPTTYPLYVLLGKLATLLIPFGDMAWRVTLVSALCAALAVALFFLLARRIAGLPGAIVAALALGVAPVGLGYLLTTTDQRPRTNDQGPTTAVESRTENRESRTEHQQSTQSKIQNLKSKIGTCPVSASDSRKFSVRGPSLPLASLLSWLPGCWRPSISRRTMR